MLENVIFLLEVKCKYTAERVVHRYIAFIVP